MPPCLVALSHRAPSVGECQMALTDERLTMPTAQQVKTDTPTSAGTVAATDAPQLLLLDPASIIVGANVRTDLPDARDFRRSIKERGVLTPITVYQDEDRGYVCLTGQRRTVEAAAVGTPTGTIPAVLVPRPDEADRITDQMVENLHRDPMRDAEVLGGVEQLALLGVSAAQITKRLAVPRPIVNAALAAAQGEQARARVQAGDLTLDQAAIMAEFEHDEAALARLNQRLAWGQGLEHEAQRLRDEAAEHAAHDAEVDRLRAAGFPALTRDEADAARRGGTLHRIDRLTDTDGNPVAENQYYAVPGAQVIVTTEWVYADEADDGDDAEDGEGDEGDESGAGPVRAFTPVWVVTDLDASGLQETGGTSSGCVLGGHGAATEEQAETRRAERRTVIANNKAWGSAETVRRQWLAGFVTRKTAPVGAEALICEAIITGNVALSKAMDHRHPQLFDLAGIERSNGFYGADAASCSELAAKPATAKAATMLTLAAVVAAWEHSTGTHTWRNPTPWDARVLAALVTWGYQPSDVEQLLLAKDTADTPDDVSTSVSA